MSGARERLPRFGHVLERRPVDLAAGGARHPLEKHDLLRRLVPDPLTCEADQFLRRGTLRAITEGHIRPHVLAMDEVVDANHAGAANAWVLEQGSFDQYAWSFVGGQPRRNAWKSIGEIPAETIESRALSKDLIKRGANFVGPTICYAFMQATGLVNDHLVSCFRYRQLSP